MIRRNLRFSGLLDSYRFCDLDICWSHDSDIYDLASKLRSGCL
ncbi:MAG: hypothetical protein PWP72_941 [Thermoanaerobacter sp.]|jgi:hypothetical protein|nr:hypothetical protein [Thermoanaerobacter sp.]